MSTRLTDAEQWELLIPQMGYMALLRNLRNFDQAGISYDAKSAVITRLESAEEVARSRQFPYRFLSAFKNAPSLDWGRSLERALDLSCGNVPEMSGSTLILIDTSGSMSSTVSARSEVQLYEVGALFTAVLSKRCEKVSTVIFADHAAPFQVGSGESVLTYVNRVARANGKVGHGTAIWESVVQSYQGEDRVVIFTDMQSMDSMGAPQSYGYGYGRSRSGGVKANAVSQIPFIHAFNLGGYQVTGMPKAKGRFEYGGFTDASFVLMKALEDGGF